jgi:hypothetical protein
LWLPQPPLQQTLRPLSIQILISGLTQKVITALISATSKVGDMMCLWMHTPGYLSFRGKGTPGNSHWTQFCDSFVFHLDGQDHPDVFMKLFTTSLVEEAKGWIYQLPEKSIKNIEELQRAFRVRWCDRENIQDLFLQYEGICKGPCEDIREFTDRFNLALKRFDQRLV